MNLRMESGSPCFPFFFSFLFTISLKKHQLRKQHESKCLRAWQRVLGMFSSQSDYVRLMVIQQKVTKHLQLSSPSSCRVLLGSESLRRTQSRRKDIALAQRPSCFVEETTAGREHSVASLQRQILCLLQKRDSLIPGGYV